MDFDPTVVIQRREATKDYAFRLRLHDARSVETFGPKMTVHL